MRVNMGAYSCWTLDIILFLLLILISINCGLFGINVLVMWTMQTCFPCLNLVIWILRLIIKWMSSLSQSKCETCCLSKSHILPFSVHNSRALASFDIIHSDVWGIAPTLSRTGFKYYVTIIDDHSRRIWIYFLHMKSEVFSIFQNFITWSKPNFRKQSKF